MTEPRTHARFPEAAAGAGLYESFYLKACRSAGGRHDTVNCSIATMRLVVHRPGRDPAELECVRGAAYELGMRERDHGVPLQPYPDGPRAAD